MVHLLKQKSKVIVARKDRTKHDPADVFNKRPKYEEKKNDAPKTQQTGTLNNTGAKDTKKIQPQIIEKYDHEMK